MTYVEPSSPSRSLLEALRRKQQLTRLEAAERLKTTPAGQAYRLGTDHKLLFRWERYEAMPGPESVQALVELYRCDHGELLSDLHHGRLRHRYGDQAPGAVPVIGSRAADGQAAPPRLADLLGAGTDAVLGQLGVTQRDLAGRLNRCTVDAASLAELDETLSDLEWDLETGRPVVPLITRAEHCLHQVQSFIAAGQPTRPRRRLHRAAGQFAAVVGRALAGAGALLPANDWLQTAQRAATEAGDPTLNVWILVYRSQISYTTGDNRTLLRAAERAQQLAERSGSAITRVRVGGLLALAHARLGDTDSYWTARKLAEHAATQTADADRKIGPQRFTEAAQAEVLAHGAALLGLPEAAELAAAALAHPAAHWVGWQPHAQLDLAIARINAGDVDQAEATIWSVLDTTPDDRRAPVARHLAEVLDALSAAGYPRIDALFDQLRHRFPPGLRPMVLPALADQTSRRSPRRDRS